uniref:Uncharacterized protein n=1 Tax=Candidatus Kentrum sp. UNK TaxID=2126344 RepID=A0A451ASW0_9GAMM|nr:MAG: hypothetical protein BECKUNK1418G_GA0071005_13073 [Candidatus Kentron sp. UNK]VFK73800.1 MAG: hypothetical protein BECKUNK1418H_GA0071006_12963 [Candidatus Kentron sp. UNK]
MSTPMNNSENLAIQWDIARIQADITNLDARLDHLYREVIDYHSREGERETPTEAGWDGADACVT